MTFRELPIGTSFQFHPGVWTFSSVCKKISARRYTWPHASGETLTSRVGTVNVQVKEVTA